MRLFLFVVLLNAAFGCIRNKKIPEGIIPQNEMRKLMWDLIRADAFVADFVMKDSTRNQKQESTTLYEKIFSIHSTTQQAFKKSLEFYQGHPDLFKPIADSLKSDEKKAMEYPQKSQKPDTVLKKNPAEQRRVRKIIHPS